MMYPHACGATSRSTEAHGDHERITGELAAAQTEQSDWDVLRRDLGRDGGGEVLVGPKGMGPGSAYAVIKDPAGAVSALYQVGS